MGIFNRRGGDKPADRPVRPRPDAKPPARPAAKPEALPVWRPDALPDTQDTPSNVPAKFSDALTELDDRRARALAWRESMRRKTLDHKVEAGVITEEEANAASPYWTEQALRADATAAARADADAARQAAQRERLLMVFGLDGSATPEQIRSEYRKLAQECHPDRHPNATHEEKARLAQQFQDLRVAYQKLTGQDQPKEFLGS